MATCVPEAARGGSIPSAAWQQNKYHVDTFSAVLQAGVCPTGTFSPESLFSETQGARPRRREQRSFVRVGCGNGCWLAVGSGRLFLPKHVISIAGVSEETQTTLQKSRDAENFLRTFGYFLYFSTQRMFLFSFDHFDQVLVLVLFDDFPSQVCTLLPSIAEGTVVQPEEGAIILTSILAGRFGQSAFLVAPLPATRRNTRENAFENTHGRNHVNVLTTEVCPSLFHPFLADQTFLFPCLCTYPCMCLSSQMMPRFTFCFPPIPVPLMVVERPTIQIEAQDAMQQTPYQKHRAPSELANWSGQRHHSFCLTSSSIDDHPHD